MLNFAVFIEENVDSIVDEWEDFARSVGTAAHLSPEELRDHAKVVLQSLASDIGRYQGSAEQRAKSLGQGLGSGKDDVARTCRQHAQYRFEQGFTLPEMVSEYRAMRASVIRRWTMRLTGAADGQLAELTRFGESVDEGLTEAIAWYSQRLEDSRNLLVGVLAHDLRNPLSAVKMSADYLLRTENLGDAELRAVSRIAASSDRMTRYVADLLDFTQTLLGAGLAIVRSDLDLAELIADVVDELRAANPLATIELASDGPLPGRWDPSRLSQLLGNLVANAINHGERDKPVSVLLQRSATGARVDVRNFGDPIPATAYPRLFEPLTDASESQRRRGSSGLGLGLYIARGIAVAHGGAISVRSDLVDGTTFSVDLPTG